MTIFTVFEPENADAASSLAQWADGVALVPERLIWTAIPFAPLVLLAHRLWFALLGYALVQGLIVGAVLWFDLTSDALVLLPLTNVAVAVLLPGLRRAKLAAAGYEEVGVVVAPSLEAAEQRYIEARLGGVSFGGSARAPLPAERYALAAHPASERPVLGLFPEASR
ncbi:DUF2628 domain-containing protein [Ancylobacter sp. VNQ12]|uniref:DUF2628 domain-containing protein n=1 Tax=Ancylobacter sp. VNQ12 TaxID=3400920 RepID=UPI003BFCD83B